MSANRDAPVAQPILAARHRRLGADGKPPEFPQGSFDECRTIADRISRSRQLLMLRGS
jgi:hypothetical protein